MNKRIQKRWKRENRPDKGVSTESFRQKRNAAIRAAHLTLGYPNMEDQLLLAAAAMIGKRR